MRHRPLARTALAALALLAGCEGHHRYRSDLPTDEYLMSFFRAHRADLETIRVIDQTEIRLGAGRYYEPLSREWERLIRKLGLPGGGVVESADRIFIPVRSLALPGDSVDVKGFAWIVLPQPKSARLDTLPDLDALNPRDRSSAGRHLRRLDGSWSMYRWIDRRMRSEGD